MEDYIRPGNYDEILAQGLEGCGACNHVPESHIQRVRDTKKAVLWARMSEGGWGPEHEMGALVELKEGYAVVYESEDSTGHGCQCSGDITFFPTLDEAVRMGLEVQDRADFKRLRAEKTS